MCSIASLGIIVYSENVFEVDMYLAISVEFATGVKAV
jgi:hypothetical protein